MWMRRAVVWCVSLQSEPAQSNSNHQWIIPAVVNQKKHDISWNFMIFHEIMRTQSFTSPSRPACRPRMIPIRILWRLWVVRWIKYSNTQNVSAPQHDSWRTRDGRLQKQRDTGSETPSQVHFDHLSPGSSSNTWSNGLKIAEQLDHIIYIRIAGSEQVTIEVDENQAELQNCLTQTLVAGHAGKGGWSGITES